MVNSPIELVNDYLRCLKILNGFVQEDETINGFMLISKAVERIIMENPSWFKDFLSVVEKHRVEIALKHHGNIPLAYYYERWLGLGDCKEFVG